MVLSDNEADHANSHHGSRESSFRLLAECDLSRLEPLLKKVDLTLKQNIYRVHTPIDFVYFPMTGLISAMTVMRDGTAIEVATVGNEGMTGIIPFVGGELSANEVMVQVAGEGLRMDVDDFRKESALEGPFRRILGRYNAAFQVQVSYSVACNGLHNVSQRCCRWLLMTQDRIGSNVLPLTHEFLGIMLGVRRASVTDVLQPLQERGLIRNERGVIEILDRPGMEVLSCECYSAVKKEFDKVFDDGQVY